MRTDLYEEMYYLEEYYWWHVAKRELVISLINKYKVKTQDDHKLLDLGCGTGMVLQSLKNWGANCWGIDSSIDAIAFCNKRGLRQVAVSNIENKLPFPDNNFDIVLALDVIEHLQEDKKILVDIKRILKPNGILIVIVPAYKKLWSYWDEILDHKRRYSKYELNHVMHSSGFKINEMGYSNCFILPLTIATRFIKARLYGNKYNRKKATSDFIPLPTWLNILLLGLSRVEHKISQYGKLPFGLSLYVVGIKDA